MTDIFYETLRVAAIADAAGEIALTYDPDWLSRSSAFPISMTMPLRPEPYGAEAVVPWLANLLPETHLQRIGQVLRVSPQDILGILSQIGRDTAGALSFDLGTHVMFVGLIEEIRTAAHNRPLLYLDGGWASLVRASEGELEAYREAMQETIGIIDQATDGDDDPSEQLRRFVQDFARINLEQIETTRSFFGHEAYAPAAELLEINAMKSEFDGKLKDLLRRGVESKAVTIEDPQMAALAMTGMMLWMHRWYKGNGRLRNEEIERQFASLALTIGLKSGEGGRVQ